MSIEQNSRTCTATRERPARKRQLIPRWLIVLVLLMAASVLSARLKAAPAPASATVPVELVGPGTHRGSACDGGMQWSPALAHRAEPTPSRASFQMLT